MLPATLFLFSVLTPPAAFDLDTRSYLVGADAAIHFMVAIDGTRATYTVNILNGSTSETIAEAVAVSFGAPHWRAVKVSDTVVRARGTAKAPILFLTVTSKRWAPDVTRYYPR